MKGDQARASQRSALRKSMRDSKWQEDVFSLIQLLNPNVSRFSIPMTSFPSNYLTPIGYLTIQLYSDTNSLKLVSDFTGL